MKVRVCLVIALSAWGISCGGGAKSQAPPQLPPPLVSVVEVQPEDVAIYSEYTAQTFARDMVEVRGRVDGYIEKRLFQVGSDVKAGEVLYTLDSRPYQADVAKAKGELEQSRANLEFARKQVALIQAQADLAQAQANLIKAKQDVARLEPLVKEEAAPTQDLDNARAALNANQANVDSRKANLEQSRLSTRNQIDATTAQVQANEALLRTAELNLEYATIHAPIAGRIGDSLIPIRRLTEASRAQYLASEEARHGVTTTLISDVTTGYFNLREADLELQIAKATKAVAERSLKLTTIRRDRGVATSLDVRQSEQFLYTATGQIAAAEKQIEQDENLLSLLTAKNPQAIERGKALTEFPAPPEIPSGLPSALLERRPDIRQAEQTLIAANANIGAAKAQYFPQITLTGFLGGQSRELTNLFTGPARDWNIVPSATLPIFNAGKIRSGVRLTQAQQQEALASYEKAIKTSFHEVADAIVGYRKTAEQRAQQELLVKALQDTDRLSTLRYQGGLDSYLQVLDAERNLFQGELDLARLRRDELVSIVTLYRALGGGWQ